MVYGTLQDEVSGVVEASSVCLLLGMGTWHSRYASLYVVSVSYLAEWPYIYVLSNLLS